MTGGTVDLSLHGGKGLNLTRLRDAGLPVPPFVIVDTGEYDAFVAAHELSGVIAGALARPGAEASVIIRDAFASATLSAEQRARLLNALAPLLTDGALAGPVAVRSSATAEDLPGLSFAGQQDSFLDVATVEDVLARIVECWSSLWTERALAYRTRNGIDHAQVSIAVVVQAMVDADAAGVLFTANPRTGKRSESVVDAVLGLGEALVSGQVTPDNFVCDTMSGEVLSHRIEGAQPSLRPSHLQALLALGRRVVELYREPMDIEWARLGDELFVLQARPITSLYPLPAPNPGPYANPEVWFSFGAFQGLLEPITPLGRDAIRILLAGAPRIVGRRIDWRTNRSIQPAGERLWMRLDGLMRIRAIRTILDEFFPYVEPASAAIMAELAAEPELRPTRAMPSARLMAAMATVLPGVVTRMRSAEANPVAARRALDRACEDLVRQIGREIEVAGRKATPQERLTARVDALDSMGRRALPTLLPVFAPIMLPSILNLRRIRELAARTKLPDAESLALAVMRALPGNVTTSMDLALADVAFAIRGDATSWGWVAETAASDLARQFRTGRLPRVAQHAIAGFLDVYGMRGVAEIDLGAPRWREDPTPVMHTIKSYLALPADAHPREVHRAGQHEAGRSIRRMMDASTPGRAQKVKRAAQTIRSLAGARETPKFTLVRCLGLIREGIEASAAELVEQGRLASTADIAFLRTDELRRAFTAEWHEVVAHRRALRETESRRAQVPRVLVSDGRTFYEGLGGDGDLRGAGVSPGVAEGVVRVVHDPRTTQLRPGEILVCRGTDPAWTPLFLTASALITEVGGMMTHGSVVAREYGIPAVVGVHDATTALTDGQRIRIDGTSGQIVIL
ncbi:MAG: PEP/pyruvate-binding domain-containing protein [Propioniciclava sp.]|uniref:PEP/pyruvate-binding domain-containing protein n=1 Tax=Propioniciclava sp. TaxID=2038686 RepID=UPI0039E521CF